MHYLRTTRASIRLSDLEGILPCVSLCHIVLNTYPLHAHTPNLESIIHICVIADLLDGFEAVKYTQTLRKKINKTMYAYAAVCVMKG